MSGSGSFYNSAGTAVSTVTTIDKKSDGNAVHATTTFWKLTQPNTSTPPSWSPYGSKSTPAFSNQTLTQTVSTGYPSTGSQMRGSVQSCAQLGWPVPDSCTDPATLTVSY